SVYGFDLLLVGGPIDYVFFFFFYCYRGHRDLHSFPTRRSSDLAPLSRRRWCRSRRYAPSRRLWSQLPRRRRARRWRRRTPLPRRDRKSTRLNSSHVSISYAVFCLKKKKFQPLVAPISCYTTTIP